MDVEQHTDDYYEDGLSEAGLGEDHAVHDASERGEPQDDSPGRRKSDRIDEYERWALEKADPLAACLGSLCADLLHISSALGETIKTSLTAAPKDLESVRRIGPALNDQLRVTRQIERFAQLEIRAAESRQKYRAGRGPISYPADDAYVAGPEVAFQPGLGGDNMDSSLEPKHAPLPDSIWPLKPR